MTDYRLPSVNILWLPLLITWLLLGCDTPPTPAPPAQNVTQSAEIRPADDLHLLYADSAQVRRTAWDGFHPVSWGTVLRRGDLIQAGDTESARIVCDTLTLTMLPAGQTKSVNELCPAAADGATRLKSGQFEISGSRGGIAPGLPYIITPRHTAVYTTTPHLNWHPVVGTLTYTVRIDNLGTGQTIWQTATQGTELLAPQLERGHSYLVVVEAVSDAWMVSSAEEERPRLGFAIIDDARAEDVAAWRERVLSMGLNSAERHFTLAALYQTERLYSDAITHLNHPSLYTKQSPHRQQRLGELYHRTLLESSALTSYERSLELGLQHHDLEAVGVANARIAAHHFSFWRAKAAYEAAEDALKVYTSLGDVAQIERQHVMMASAAAGYADDLLAQQHPVDARTWYQAALALYTELDDEAAIMRMLEKIEQVER